MKNLNSEVFSWDSVSKSTHGHCLNKEKWSHSVTLVLGWAPEVPTAPDGAQGPGLATPGGRTGRKKGHAVCAVGCLLLLGW